MYQCGTATSHNAFFKSCTGGGNSVLDAVLAFLGLDLRCCTHLDDAYATGELSQAFFELFAIPFRINTVDFGAELVNAFCNSFCGASTFNDGGVVLGNGDAAGRTELLDSH